MKICIHVYLNISDFPYLYELLKVLSEEGNAEPEVKFMWILIHFVYTLCMQNLKRKKELSSLLLMQNKIKRRIITLLLKKKNQTAKLDYHLQVVAILEFQLNYIVK